MTANCINPDCNKEPSYNCSSETITLYCYNHKKNDMIDFDELRW